MVAKKSVRKKAIKSSKVKPSLLKDFNFFKPRTSFQFLFKNFLLFLGLSFVSFLGYKLIPNLVFANLFQTIFVVFGAVSCALLISILVFLILRLLRK